MANYLNLNNELDLLKIKTRDDEIKNLKYQTEKHDHENNLKSLKFDNECYKKKYRSLNKRKYYLLSLKFLLVVRQLLVVQRWGLINPGAGIFISSSTALLTSMAILIAKEYISKLKIRFTKLRGWTIVITLLYEKTLKISMTDKKIDEKEAQELKKT